MTGKTVMAEHLKEEIAKELGVYEKVKQDGGWGNVSSKDCGNIISIIKNNSIFSLPC